MTSRIDRLRASLEEPLLVSNPINVQYLFGFKSSNAALLVEPDGVRLFTDFRYAEAARAIDGVRFEETRRALLWDLAEHLSGPIGFESVAAGPLVRSSYHADEHVPQERPGEGPVAAAGTS